MKKLFTLLFVISLFLVTGCNDKKPTVLTLKEGIYYDKNNMHNGESLERITLKGSNNVERITCGADAGCSLFNGIYSIEGTKLSITLTHYSDEIDGWTLLDENETIEYTITKDNEFTKDASVFVFDGKEGDDSDEGVKPEYKIELKKEKENFELGKLNLEFIGNKNGECEDCYYYDLNIKYDGKAAGDGFFNDVDSSRIFSSNMAASFEIYKIDEVYVFVSSIASQCYGRNILMFNTARKTLKMYSNADITFEGKNITVELPKSDSCMEEGTKYNFEVSGLELKEK